MNANLGSTINHGQIQIQSQSLTNSNLSRGALQPEHEKIHQYALSASRNFKRAEAELLEALIQVESSRVFLMLGYSSLFSYAVQALGLSEAVAANAITVARKARELPALKKEIETGAIGISKAKKMVSVITIQNQDAWVLKAKTLSTRALEKEVARVNPQQVGPERASPSRSGSGQPGQEQEREFRRDSGRNGRAVSKTQRPDRKSKARCCTKPAEEPQFT